MHNNFYLLKTFAYKPKDKDKSSSNKIYLYCSKLDHNKCNYYYMYPNKEENVFWERNKDKITKFRYITRYKNAKNRPSIASLLNAKEFIVQNTIYSTNSIQDKK